MHIHNARRCQWVGIATMFIKLFKSLSDDYLIGKQLTEYAKIFDTACGALQKNYKLTK
jgi:hypothetical protein